MNQKVFKKTNYNFSLLCLNIANPSEERAGKQAMWLKRRSEDVIVLTEAKDSKGCVLIERYLSSFGNSVIFVEPPEREYGVMIISKHPIAEGDFSGRMISIPSRVASVKIGQLEIIGVYVPSRGFDEGAIMAKKKKFIQSTQKALLKILPPQKTIFCGDLNVLEPEHLPKYRHFKDWEYDFYNSLSQKYSFIDAFRHFFPKEQAYSWFGRSGDGYRYDHCFVSPDLSENLAECYYLHEPRETGLSDHSAMILRLKLNSLI
ncbi:hypothetical protein L6252_02330 [Candidatus Parcubacteria bacterium]|nr:hypothetical protein [Candidatus Parcubacteria bacterium]